MLIEGMKNNFRKSFRKWEKKSEMANMKVQSRLSNIQVLEISERKDREKRWKI